MQQAAEMTGSKRTGRAAAILAGTGVAGTGRTEAPRAGSAHKRVELMVETLSHLRGKGESLAEVAHDARNMVTALGLYCDLLTEPGVLNSSYRHYAGELRLVASASRRLVEKLLALDFRQEPGTGLSRSSRPEPERVQAVPSAAARQEPASHWDEIPAGPISNLAAEVLANRDLLAALAGPSIALTVDAEGGAVPVRLTGEDLTRILVNLVKNAAEAMPGGGRIQLGLRTLAAEVGAAADGPSPMVPKPSPTRRIALTVEDNGPGIPVEMLEKIFAPGCTTRSCGALRNGGWPASHRGLGLSITRSIVEASGGSIRAANRSPSGACFEIELPVRSR